MDVHHRSPLAVGVEAAHAAPSVYNTQPWLFDTRRDQVDLLADHDRRLAIVDPDGRELYVSVGAAAMNLRLAMLAEGLQPIVRLVPRARGDVVVRVTAGRAITPTATAEALAAAIPRRRTNRSPYASAPIPATVAEELRAAAHAEGATLRFLDPVRRGAVLALAVSARRLETDPAYLEELGRWTSTDAAGREGVPMTAFGYQDTHGALPLRDFSAATPEWTAKKARFERHPAVAVLATHGDTIYDWIRAGQALQRVLLTATVRGLAAQPMTQPLEIPSLRHLVNNVHSGQYAQMLLRIGYGAPVPRAARRPIDNVLR
jgi:nitroreductase